MPSTSTGDALDWRGGGHDAPFHVVNASADQSLADEVALRLIDWGMVPSEIGIQPKRSTSQCGHGSVIGCVRLR